MLFSHRVLRTVSEAIYALLVLVTAVAAGLSCAAVISQAVRTSQTQDWTNNFNALVVGATYIILVGVMCCSLDEINADTC